MTSRAVAGSAWYLHFWPWFIVALLGVSVVGSLATVYIAFVHRDTEIERGAPGDSRSAPSPAPPSEASGP